MTTTTTDVDQVVQFHGHMCGGLALGIRAVEAGLRELGPDLPPVGLVAVVETSTCSVDAVQYLTGCTLGKGNLVQKDHGKSAFTFWRTGDTHGVRVAATPEFGLSRADRWPLMARIQAGQATDEERAGFTRMQQEWSAEILAAPEDQILTVRRVDQAPPARTPLAAPVACGACGEAVMESRTQRREGLDLCGDCVDTAQRRVTAAAAADRRCACSY